MISKLKAKKKTAMYVLVLATLAYALGGLYLGHLDVQSALHMIVKVLMLLVTGDLTQGIDATAIQS